MVAGTVKVDVVKMADDLRHTLPFAASRMAGRVDSAFFRSDSSERVCNSVEKDRILSAARTSLRFSVGTQKPKGSGRLF